MIEGRSGGSWRGTRRELWAPLERFFNQRIVRCIVYRRSTLAAHSFPSLRRFLTLAPACWSRGFTRRSRHTSWAGDWSSDVCSSDLMIEGRSGGSGRGTRKELWAHLTAVLQPADRTLYRVRSEERRVGKECLSPPLPHPRTCMLATGKDSAAHVRTFSWTLGSA